MEQESAENIGCSPLLYGQNLETTLSLRGQGWFPDSCACVCQAIFHFEEAEL